MLLRTAIERFDLEGYLVSLGAQPGKTHEWVLTCPMCGKPKLVVNLLRRTWHCWVCERYAVGADGRRRPIVGAGGLVDLIQLLEGTPRERVVDRLLTWAKYQHVPIDTLSGQELKSDFMGEIRSAVPVPPPEFWHPATGNLPFCLQRGITEQDIQIFGLGWCSAGRNANRFVFPVWEWGSLVYYQARAMWRPAPGERFIKALNPPAVLGGAVSGDLLFNLEQAAQFPRVAITEGPMDAVKTGPDAVCTFGKQISAAQIGRLLRRGVRAVDLIWDGPSPTEPRGAWDEMIAVAPLLGALFDLRLVFLPQGDPGERSREEISWYRSQAVPFAALGSRLQRVG